MKKYVRKSKITLLTAMIIVLSLFLLSCSADPTNLKYLDKEVVVTGLTDEAIPLKISDFVAMEATKEKAEGLRSNGDVVKFTAVGPSIDTLLKEYGKTREDYTSVRFSATDGFSVIIPKEVFKNRQIVLAYMNGNKALDKYNVPLRVIVVGERAMYWARMLDKIEFLTDEDAAMTNKIVFMDTILPAMKGEYSEEEGGDVVSTIDILTKYGGGSLEEGAKVHMAAYDDLKKVELMENFLKGGIKYTGELTPQFCSPELPQGMNMDGIVSIRSEGVVYYSLERASEKLRVKEFDGKDGYRFSDIIGEIGFVSAASFRFETLDGELKFLKGSEMSEGVFVRGKSGVDFIGPNNLEIKDIAYLEAVDPVAPEEQKEQGEQ